MRADGGDLAQRSIGLPTPVDSRHHDSRPDQQVPPLRRMPGTRFAVGRYGFLKLADVAANGERGSGGGNERVRGAWRTSGQWKTVEIAWSGDQIMLQGPKEPPAVSRPIQGLPLPLFGIYCV